MWKTCKPKSTGQLIAIPSLVTELITYRAKLLNADWSMKRVFFLNFALRRGQNYSLTIGPQVT